MYLTYLLFVVRWLHRQNRHLLRFLVKSREGGGRNWIISMRLYVVLDPDECFAQAFAIVGDLITLDFGQERPEVITDVIAVSGDRFRKWHCLHSGKTAVDDFEPRPTPRSAARARPSLKHRDACPGITDPEISRRLEIWSERNLVTDNKHA